MKTVQTFRDRIKVRFSRGLHLRCASQLIQLLNQFECKIRITKNGKPVQIKDVMDLLLLGANCGSDLEIEASGKEAGQAVMAIQSFFRNESNFSDHE